jgi:dTDP-4-dehydrorhamnose reductase
MIQNAILLTDNNPISSSLRTVIDDSCRVVTRGIDFNPMEPGSCDRILSEGGFGTVINAVEFGDIDEAEYRREEAYRVNAFFCRDLAESCKSRGMLLVQISTACVFDGEADAPYRESDRENPISAFGDSKLLGERMIQEFSGEHLIVRTADMYGPGLDPLRLRFIRREEGDALAVMRGCTVSPVYSLDAAESLMVLIGKGARGTVHAGQEGTASALDFVVETIRVIYKIGSGENVNAREIDRREVESAGERPLNSTLDISLCNSITGTRSRSWQEAMRDYTAFTLDRRGS